MLDSMLALCLLIVQGAASSRSEEREKQLGWGSGRQEARHCVVHAG